MATLQAFLLYKLLGVPVYAYLIVGALVPANMAVKKAGWTTAENLVQLAARFVLKIPAIGALVALVPGVGDILDGIADDEATPKTLNQRIAGPAPSVAQPDGAK